MKQFVIKDINENQWFVKRYKGSKYPNFNSSAGYAKKYRFWILAKIQSLFLGNCIVERLS